MTNSADTDEGAGVGGLPKSDEDIGYEEAHAELEEIVRTLERGEASLERTLELWERGEKLYAICTARLDAAHGRVEELTRELEAQAENAGNGSTTTARDADGVDTTPSG